MTTLAANMEWLCTEAGPQTADRIRAAAKAGFTQVEIWGWRDKDLAAVKSALAETGVTLQSMIVDPQLLIADPSTHEAYLDAVKESVAVAQDLGSPNLVVVANQKVGDLPIDVQLANVTSVLTEAARLVPEGMTMLLEPLNDKVDHKGTLLTTTAQGLRMVQEVDSPRFKLLLDAYHSLMMGENPAAEISGCSELVGHVQIADVPGRGEPGSGAVDWAAQIDAIKGAGYAGSYGLEFLPTRPTADAVAEILRIAQS